MRTILYCLASCLALAFLATTLFAQGNPKPGIQKRLNEGMEERNKALNDAMSGDETKTPAAAAPTAGWIERKLPAGGSVRMYFAHPAIDANKKANLPALIVIQEWWGVNDDIQERTREFAAKGFYAMAVDLYDGKVAKDPKEAAALKSKLTDAGALTRLQAGVSLLSESARDGTIDPARIGVIGWCMGGEQALKLAVADKRVKAVVMFYGTPVTEVAKLKNIQGPVLGIFGKEDKSIPNEKVDELEKALKEANIPNEIRRYDGVGHAFASKAAKVMNMYNEQKAAEAWQVTWDWLDKNLQKAK